MSAHRDTTEATSQTCRVGFPTSTTTQNCAHDTKAKKACSPAASCAKATSSSPIRSIGERLAPIATFCSSGATRRTTTWHGIRQAMQTAWLQEHAPATRFPKSPQNGAASIGSMYRSRTSSRLRFKSALRKSRSRRAMKALRFIRLRGRNSACSNIAKTAYAAD